MKSIKVLGTVVTAKTASDYLANLARIAYESLDIHSSLVFDEQAQCIVEAGFLTWEQVEDIELKAIA